MNEWYENMKVSSVFQMRSLDQRAIEEFGIKAELLMENAGHAAYDALRQESVIPGKRFLVFCGAGNNGGDGCVLARKIHSNGGDVKVFLLADPGRYKGAAKFNYKIVTRLPVEIQRITSTEGLHDDIARCDLIVDAIFGTGLSRDITGIYRNVIEHINLSGKPVLSIDIPSGVHGDTGEVMGVGVKADYTVTFGLPKFGNVFHPGYDLGGKLFVSHISFPPAITTADNLKVEINQPFDIPPLEGKQPKDNQAEADHLAQALSTEIEIPLFVDGDSIIASKEDAYLTKTSNNLPVFMLDTNHLSKISGKSVQDIKNDKVAVLQQTSAATNATIILKEIPALIAFPDQRVYINLTGYSVLGCDRLWNALDDTIKAMFSQGYPLQQAIRQGVFIHGLAGDLMAEEKDQAEIMSQDILNALPRAVNMIKKGLDTERIQRYVCPQLI
jgi:hydroxyethylthiazole kinase-like uncharacterized protein yjeF